MGFSPLADMRRRIPDGGRSSPRNSEVTGFGIHHNAGVDAYKEASNPSRQVSANYWITNSGAIIPNVDEDRRAWTSGDANYPAGAQADHRNITVEVSNSPEGVRNGTWAISDAALKALIKLIADVYKRRGLGKVVRSASKGVGVHRDWVPTECPGQFIMGKLPYIIDQANAINSGKPSKPSSKPKEEEEEEEEEMNNYSISADIKGNRIQAVFNPISGFFTKWTTGSQKYTENVRKTFGVKAPHSHVTESHFNAIERDCARVGKVEVSGTIAVGDDQ